VIIYPGGPVNRASKILKGHVLQPKPS